ncbi:uncharacterized protein LOC143283278 [Babylonia areolata]|uniref:uncharacterized protein LOC143283278 n=1 Tax=Babylonia areolata TaxID=304850 RepID=UPI003FD31363
MPELENRQALVLLVVLLLAVPAQYFITHVGIVPDSSSRHVAFQRLLSTAIGFRNKYLSLTAWSEWCQGILGVFGGEGGDDDANGESPAVEVLQYNQYTDKRGHFGSSTEPRLYRPAEVKFRIGQVVRHKFWKYRGVIIGWDLKPRAPKEWLEENYPSSEKHLLHMPAFTLLVDVRDRMTPQLSYVPGEEIEVIDKTRVMHPRLDYYFESYDRGQYTPRPWLQSIYPED